MAKREIKWTSRALRDKIAIMEYWYQHNKSVDYPLKLERLFSSSLSLLIRQPFAGTFYDKKEIFVLFWSGLIKFSIPSMRII